MSETTWSVAELVGLSVETEEGERLGFLKGVLHTAANDVFVVAEEGKEVLVPALKSVVLEISLEKKKITVRLPKGLKEVYEPAPKTKP